jgi:hypothetical protein
MPDGCLHRTVTFQGSATFARRQKPGTECIALASISDARTVVVITANQVGRNFILAESGTIDYYLGLTGPPNPFGTGGESLAVSAFGNLAGINGGLLAVPDGYASGALLSAASATFSDNNASGP